MTPGEQAKHVSHWRLHVNGRVDTSWLWAWPWERGGGQGGGQLANVRAQALLFMHSSWFMHNSQLVAELPDAAPPSA